MSEFRDAVERYLDSLTEVEIKEVELMTPDQLVEAMKNAGYLRDDMNNGGRVGFDMGGLGDVMGAGAGTVG